MVWSINLSGASNIRSFKIAQEHWAGIKGWKNKPASWRPLHTRRKQHVRLNRLNDEAGYECVLHSTPMVTYYANGDVKLIGHNSVSSREFAWRTTPAGVTPVSNNGYMYWKVDTPDGVRYYRDQTYLMLTPAFNGRWQLLNEPVEETEKTLNLKKAAAVRKLLSYYDKWEKLTERLTGAYAYMHPTYPDRKDIRALLASPEDPELFARLRERIGSVDEFRNIAYELMGAYDEAVVPHDRLPKRQR